VHPLDLNIEQRLSGDVDPKRVADKPRQRLLVMLLNRAETLAKGGVIRKFFEFTQLLKIAGLDFKSQRRGVIPFVLLLNLDGQYSAKSLRTLFRRRSVCSSETPLTEEDPTIAR